MFSLNKFTYGLLNDSNAYALDMKKNESLAYGTLDLNEIIDVDFPDNQYFKIQTPKKQIVLHHTVSGVGVDGDISWWRQTSDRIGTAVIIGADGKIYQCFSSIYWAYHLGLKTDNNTALNKGSIGIEIDSWGGLIESNGKWYPAKWDSNLNSFIPNIRVSSIANVTKYPKGYKGFYGYESYSDEQIDAVYKLLKYWGGKYNIPLNYNEDMFNVSNRALNGTPGVWSHTSFRADKSDCHPQPEIIEMLKSLM
jgi:hypothetical protein